MDKIPEFDMYEFVDDGVNKSFYTILGQYLPKELNGDFSTASLINCLLDVPTIAQQQVPIKAAYKGYYFNRYKCHKNICIHCGEIFNFSSACKQYRKENPGKH